eukprot:COSAG05_NODE_2221_length_3375_cov_1.818681_4_plen_82_part_00
MMCPVCLLKCLTCTDGRSFCYFCRRCCDVGSCEVIGLERMVSVGCGATRTMATAIDNSEHINHAPRIHHSEPSNKTPTIDH